MAAVGAEVGLDIPLAAIGADPACVGVGLLCATVGAEIGGNAGVTAGGTIPTHLGFGLLATAVGTEVCSWHYTIFKMTF